MGLERQRVLRSGPRVARFDAVRHTQTEVQEYAEGGDQGEARLPEALRIHYLRHSAVSIVLTADEHVDLAHIEDTVGHPTINTAINVYGRVHDKARQRVASAVVRCAAQARAQANDSNVAALQGR